MWQKPGPQQFTDHSGCAPRAVEVFAQIGADRLHIDEEWHGVAEFFPISVAQRDAKMRGDGIEVDRRIC